MGKRHLKLFCYCWSNYPNHYKNNKFCKCDRYRMIKPLDKNTKTKCILRLEDMDKDELILALMNYKQDLLRELANINGKHDQLMKRIADLNYFIEKATANDKLKESDINAKLIK